MLTSTSMTGTKSYRGPEEEVINAAWKSIGRHPRGEGILARQTFLG